MNTNERLLVTGASGQPGQLSEQTPQDIAELLRGGLL